MTDFVTPQDRNKSQTVHKTRQTKVVNGLGTKISNSKKLMPVKPGNMKLGQHGFQLYDVTIPRAVENLEDPDMWSMVAAKLNPGDELRVLAADFSMRALLLVTFRQGSVVKLVQLERKDLEAVDYTTTFSGRYQVQFSPMHKWCVVDTEAAKVDEEIVKKDIPTQALAYKELEDFVKATAA